MEKCWPRGKGVFGGEGRCEGGGEGRRYVAGRGGIGM